MSKFYIPGPAPIFIGVGISPSITGYFLGYSESGVQVLLSPLTEDIAADYAGAMPADVAMLGEEARISFTLARYSEAILNILSSFLNAKAIGSASANQLGSVYVQEGNSLQVWVESPYQVKTDLTDMIPGFFFPAVYVTDTIDQPLSIRVKKPNVSFRAIPTFAPSTPGGGLNTYILYTTVKPSWVPSIS